MRSTLDKEIVHGVCGTAAPGCDSRRRRKIAISLIGMGLGDRIILEAPLRIHRKNCPNDYLVGIVDRNGVPDLPHTLRRHFDEIWWVASGNGREWNGSRRSAVGRRVRDALIAAGICELYSPPWKSPPVPRNAAYRIVHYNCFGEGDHLRRLGVYPRVVVPPADRRWAEQFLHTNVNGRYEALVSIHVRNVWFSPERNLDLRLIEDLIGWIRSHRRFGFLLLGRDDRALALAGPDLHSFVGEKWSFEQTAAIIARTRLFIGGESGLTHAAAGLGVPLIGIEYMGDHAIPFAPPRRYLCFYKGESPQTMRAEVGRFVGRLFSSSARRQKHAFRQVAQGPR